MPELTWVGKDRVLNHHHDVPYRILDRQYTFNADASRADDDGNMIIHGDNLGALKSLLPRYEGKVDVIYIDPPYNTGNEGWIYNDNVNDPRIRKWLGEVVGKEGEDLSRHDKWLCMMYPRLRLLHKLLAKDGLIAVSIGDAEVNNLGALMNEIFGVTNRLAIAPVRSEPSGGKDKTALRTGHEYLLLYSKGDQSGLEKEDKSTGELDLVDEDGAFKKGRELRKWGSTSARADRETMWFEITAPNGEFALPYKNDGSEGRWRWGLTNSAMIRLLENPDEAHWEWCSYDSGVFVDGESGRWVPFEKIRDVTRSFGWNTWIDGYGTNAEGTAVIKEIFGKKSFDTPKPLSLIEWIVSLRSKDDALVLDSFAGSGTTAHAVLNLNRKDEGNRRFILVELGDYAETVTAERVRRVAEGYTATKSVKRAIYDEPLTMVSLRRSQQLLDELEILAEGATDEYDKVSGPKVKDGRLQIVGTTSSAEKVPGLGGGFSYYELGVRLLEGEDLNPDVSMEQVREYIWYTETREPLLDISSPNPYLLGVANSTVYYLLYVQDQATTLGRDFLSTIDTDHLGEVYVIYADRCTLSTSEMQRAGIVFKKIPRDIKHF